MRKQTIKLIALLFAVVLVAAACEHDGNNTNDSAALQQETEQADRVADRYNQTQPVPEFPWSQLRQNLIELLTVQATTTQTTTFFFNMGSDVPVASCPSIGFPIPATYQLTNPERGIEVDLDHSEDSAVDVAQMEATGVYTADTTGTYVMCVTEDGHLYAKYWEGFVMTDTGFSEFTDGQVVLVGEPTFDFSEGR